MSLAKQNKREGSKFMYEVIKKLATAFHLIPFNNRNHAEFQIATTQAVSKTDDGRGIDIYFKPELIYKELNIQCKSKIVKGVDSISLDVKPLFDIKATGLNILWVKLNSKTSRRKAIATVCVLYEEDLIKLLKSYYECRTKDEPLP